MQNNQNEETYEFPSFLESFTLNEVLDLIALSVNAK